MQLRTGKCRLNGYLHGVGARETDQCVCGQARETVEHFLFRCSRWVRERRGIVGCNRSKIGNLSYFLGGKTRFDGEEWKPDMKAIRATIRFALATSRLEADQR